MQTRQRYRNRKAFPAYAQTHRSVVTARRLQQAVHRATAHFEEQGPEFQRVFRQYACRRLRCKAHAVAFAPLAESLKRIRSARLVDVDDCYGWTDGHVIYVSRLLPMAFDELVGTLLHEELHCFCHARGKWLGIEREHHCMRVLGEMC